jgi:hypothetical protein
MSQTMNADALAEFTITMRGDIAVRPCVRIEIYHGGVQVGDQPDYGPVDAFVQAARVAVPSLTHYRTATMRKDAAATDTAWTVVPSFVSHAKDMQHVWVLYRSAPRAGDVPASALEVLVNFERPRWSAREVEEILSRTRASAATESPWHVGGFKTWIALTVPFDHPLVKRDELRAWLCAQPLLRDGHFVAAVCGPGLIGDAELALQRDGYPAGNAPNPLLQRPSLRPRVNDVLATLLRADAATGLAYPQVPRFEWLSFVRQESLATTGVPANWRAALGSNSQVRLHDLSAGAICVEAGALTDIAPWAPGDSWMSARRHAARVLRAIRVPALTPGAVVGLPHGASQAWLDVYDSDRPVMVDEASYA